MGWQERQEKSFFTQNVAGLHNLLLHGMGVLGVGSLAGTEGGSDKIHQGWVNQ